MPIKIEMPKLSDTMTEGTLLKWNKKVGDEVEIGDIIAEVETDKATMEMEAFDEGTLSEILVEEGAKAPVGSVLGILLEEGESAGAPAAAPAAAPAPAVSATPAATAAPATPAPVAPAPSSPPVTASGDRVSVSPLARKIAEAKGIDLSTIVGSGPGGRIVKADVGGKEGVDIPAPAATPSPAAAKPAPAASTPAPAASAPAPAAISPTVSSGDKTVPLSSMRKIIADRLLTSKTTIPHFYLHVEADVAPLMTLRKQVNAQAEQTHGNKYSINDFVIKAVINAAQAVPAVNASFNGDSIVEFEKVGVSVAVAVDDGLVTPVIKDATSKSMLQISKEVKEMAGRAREGKLLPNEFDGGTITISNLGAWGIESFDAIVNPPQAVILSIGAIVEKAVVVDGQVVPGLRMNIGVSCDHRVVDGAVGAQFINEVKKLIENPALMLV
ncbi:pyruvate dehydrogenase complex dihydrolipoamide acetyltransferase [Verrucomicrobiaceae bacterium N1E253]|uniref:Acetyltransferase component of pyruvate dehydrogenase complex n=1 Tax=Oceaniferula marina TaxID=2748318 RepID=A0A851GJT9_9BACT|nr:pyruvate dehydrogenase complex dihydrolipoamide acetyltransferase [Oceaniferula marina]NWK55435.1 pyruvate dehydrogenase complex dihydrolipoamide acetyltransferase [Oceaniferula marina]